MNLTELCAHCRNWFTRRDDDRHVGEFEIIGGCIDLPFMEMGQYFRIIGSTYNDGVWQYPTSELVDETFSGAVWAMSVPSGFVHMAKEIDEWEQKYADSVNSPYLSESFGGYSYTKSGTGASTPGWQSVFRSRLNQWRKL